MRISEALMGVWRVRRYLLRVAMERKDEGLKRVCLDKAACAVTVIKHDDLNRSMPVMQPDTAPR